MSPAVPLASPVSDSAGGGSPTAGIAPPVADVRPHRLEEHGHVRVDDYYWMRDRESPEVLAYLEAENAYTAAKLRHTEELQETLYREIVDRIVPDDVSVPVWKDGSFTYSRYVEGGDYPIWCRRKGSMEAEEEVLLDGNAEAEGHDYFAVGALEISPDGRRLAYAVDTVGRRAYDVRFRDLETGEDLPDVLAGVTGNVVWAADGRTVLYAERDPESLRWNRISRHVLGTDPSDDAVVFEEDDETFSVWVYESRSREALFVASSQTMTSEVRFLPADDPTEEPRVVEPRRRGHEYDVDHFDGRLWIRTNLDARNFRLMQATLERPGQEHWVEFLPHREDRFFVGVDLFRNHLVISEREDGLRRIRVRPWADPDAEVEVDFGEEAYSAFPSGNPDPDTTVLRYRYTSLTTPWSTIDVDLETMEQTVRKRQEVAGGGFDPGDWETERFDVVARDGELVPVSLVSRKGAPRDGSVPLLLYAYGAYGVTVDPMFSLPRLSLLERGFTYAIAHVRGSQVKGRAWYEDGRLENKSNTFHDFIDVAEHLVSEGYTSSERLFAEGGSAGGLLVGAVLNLRPDLFAGAVAEVPFVDVVTTMLDPDIPLTTGEFDEWGDPRDPATYELLLSYSPYDNVEAKDYPHLLVTTGLHDSQVQYWEPAKWVAKLRAKKTGDHTLLLHTNMAAGHGGASGRFAMHRETALVYAFLLDLAGLTEGPAGAAAGMPDDAAR